MIELVKGSGEYDVELKIVENGHLLARVPTVQGCLTQSPNRSLVEERIRDALGLFVDDAATARLHFRHVSA